MTHATIAPSGHRKTDKESAMSDSTSSTTNGRGKTRQGRPHSLTCVRAVFVLESDDGRLWIAVEPDRKTPTDGVMPHLVPEADVVVSGDTADGGLSVILKGNGHNEMDALYTAYPVAASLVPEAFKAPTEGAPVG